MLVVIGIIGLLVAIALPALSSVRRSSQTKTTKALMERMRLAVETYANAFGDYPPSSFEALGIRRSNGQNEGSELLVRCLTTTLKGGPFMELGDKQLGNTDADILTGSDPTASVYKTSDLLEAVDVWGNPLLYLHNAEYDRGGTLSLIQDGEAVRALVKGSQSEKTGQYHGLTSFQLFSAGADGQPGTEDDVWVYGE